MSKDDNKPLDDDKIGLELSDLLSAVPDAPTSDEIIKQSDLEKQLEEEKSCIVADNPVQEVQRQYLEGVEKADVLPEVQVASQPEEQITTLPEVAVMTESHSDVADKAVLNVDADTDAVGEQSKSSQLPPLPDYVKNPAKAQSPQYVIDKESQQAHSIQLPPVPDYIKNIAQVIMGNVQQNIGSGQGFLQNIKQSCGDMYRRLVKWKRFIGMSLMLVVGLSIASVIYATLTLGDISKNKQKLLLLVKETTGRDMVIDGKIDYIPFPPRFVFEKVRVKNNNKYGGDLISVDRVEVNVALVPLMLGSVNISALTLENTHINLENYTGEEPNWLFDMAVTGRETIEVVIAQYINKINLLNTTISLSNGVREQPNQRDILISSGTIVADSLSGPFFGYGDIIVKQDLAPLRFDFSVGQIVAGSDADVKMQLVADEAKINYEAKLQIRDGGNQIVGKIAAQLNEDGLQKHQLTIANYFMQSDELSSRISRGLLASHNGEISGDMLLSANVIELQDIVIDTANIAAKFSVKQELRGNGKAIIGLNIQRANLDAASRGNLNKPQQSIFEQLLAAISTNLMLNINLTAHDVTYNNNIYKSIALKGNFAKENSQIEHFTITNMPGQVMVAITGDKGSKAVSRLSASGKSLQEFIKWIGVGNSLLKAEELQEFEIDSDIAVIDGKIMLDNYHLQAGGLNISGKIAMSKADKINMDIELRSPFLDVDRFFLTDVQSNVETGNAKPSYALFDWLRRVEADFTDINMVLAADELQFRQQKITDFSTKIYYGNNKTEIRDISFNIESGKVRGQIDINNMALMPRVDTKLNIAVLDTAIVKKFLGISDSQEEIELQKESGYLSDYMFILALFNGFDGNVEFKIGELKHRDFIFNNAHGSFDVANGNVKFKDIRSALFGGGLKLSGAIKTKTRPDFNFQFQLKNADFKNFGQTIFNTGDRISGRFSASGAVIANGFSISQFVDTLSGRVQIVSRGPIYKGADLDILAHKVPSVKTLKEARYWTRIGTTQGYIGVDYMAGAINIGNGVLNFDNIALNDVDITEGTISGIINLPKWRVSLKNNFTLKSQKSAFKINMAVRGNINKPQIVWNEKAMIKEWNRIFFSN